MIRRQVAIILLCGLCLSCTRYFLESGLLRLTPGTTKSQFLTYFNAPNVEGPVLRAMKSEGGIVTEVMTLRLVRDAGSSTNEYWFVFQNGRLRQWGLPDDWSAVAATYNVNFNPAPAVRR